MSATSFAIGRGTCVRIALAAIFSSTSPASFATAHTPPIPPLPSPLVASDPSARAYFETALSPDGHWLAVRTLPADKNAGAVAIVSVDDGASRTLGALQARSTPAWDEQGRLQVRVVDPEHGVPQVQLIDPATGATVATTRDHEHRASDAGSSSGAPGYPSWAQVEERKSKDGRVVRRVEWIGHSARIDLPKGADVACQIAGEPGVLYYSQRAAERVQIFRHDLEAGTAELLVTLDGGLTDWSASPDGRALLVIETVPTRRARVVDLRNGTLLDGPWPATAAAWLDDGAARYVRVDSTDGRRLVIDRMRDRQIEYGPVSQPWPSIRPLQDGRFVVETDQSVAVCNDKLEPIRQLFALND
jgi:hypothetical protein